MIYDLTILSDVGLQDAIPRAKSPFGRQPSRTKIVHADLIIGPALGLVLPDDALVPVHLALDPVLKNATRLGELSHNLVATLSFAISANTGRKVQGLPNGKFMRSHVLLQQAECRRLRRHSAPFSSTRLEG